MNRFLVTAACTAAAATALCAGVLPASASASASASADTATAAKPAPLAGVGIQGVSGPGFPGTWMTASIPRGGSRSWTLKVTNTGNVTETIRLLPSGAMGLYAGGPAKQPASNLHNTFSATAATLAPGASATIIDTVTVPVTARLGLVPGNAPGTVASVAVNTVWAYAAPGGSGQVQIAVAAGFRQYITVTK